MRPKSIVLLMLALGCGLVASIGISQVMDRQRQPAASGETESIFVAVKDIAYGESLNMQVLKLEPWPKHLIPAGSLSNKEQVEGRLAGSRIIAGEPILEAKLIGSGEAGGAAVAIPKGYRVVAVNVDAVNSVGSLMKPSDRVDVLVYIERNPGSGINESGTKTILQDIKVFAVNDQWRRPEDAKEDAIAAKTVSLLVTPVQAEKVMLATEIGKLRLILRAPQDDTASDIADGTPASDIVRGTNEKSDRELENPIVAAPVAPTTPAAGQDASVLLSWLNSQKNQPAAAPAIAPVAPPANERFTMEILQGNEMQAVEFTKEDGGTSRWRNAAGASASPAPAPVAAPSSTPVNTIPPLEPEQPSESPAAPQLGGASEG